MKPIKHSEFILTLVTTAIFMNVYLEFILIATTSIYILYNNPKIKKSILVILPYLFILFIHALVITTYINYSILKTIQQLFLFIGYLGCYSIIFSFFQYDTNRLFEKYLKVAYAISLIGISQFVVFLIFGVKNLFILPYSASEILPGVIRVSSIVKEPGNLAGLLIPSLVFFLFSEKQKKNTYKITHFLVILSCFILTFSNAGFFIFGLSLIFYLITRWRKRIKSIVVSILLISSVLLISNKGHIVSITTRIWNTINNTYDGLTNIRPEIYENMGISSYALLSNLYVALNSPSRIMGTGLGTHEQNYYARYQSSFKEYGQNAQDGYSLLIRIFSEFGIIGILILFVFIYRNININNAINIAILFLILQLLIRGGHYTLYGTIYFFFLYRFSNKRFLSQQNKKHFINAHN